MTVGAEAKALPETIDEAVDSLLAALSDEEKAEWRKVANASDLANHEHILGAGQWVRNNFGLWQDDCPLLAFYAERYSKLFVAAFADADGISVDIVERAWNRLKGLPTDTKTRLDGWYAQVSER